MRFKFKDEALQSLCSSQKELRQKFGLETSLTVQKRLLWLQAAPSLADITENLPISRRIEDRGPPPIYSICARDAGRIIFEAMGTNVTCDSDLSAIDEIMIIAFGEGS